MQRWQNAENLPPHFKRGTLSVLKKKWENPVSGTEARKETPRSSCAEVRQKAVSPTAGTEGGCVSQAESDKASGIGPASHLHSSSGVTGQFGYPGVDSEVVKAHSPESGKMENCLRETQQEVDKPQPNENPDSSGKIEKCSVPLSRLKMMFERGDASQTKGLTPMRASASKLRADNCQKHRNEVLEILNSDKGLHTWNWFVLMIKETSQIFPGPDETLF
ncbi:UNVERIFIED_CONTAM: hypothetical protein K2H54_038073 [Gekko kuhli]